MPPESAAPQDSPFTVIASRLGSLSVEQARELERQSQRLNRLPWQIGLENGQLLSADVDIIKALLSPLDSIPGYELVDLIGRGGMGVVYRARQISLKRMVALKTILLSQLSDPVAAQRFENEAQVLARVTHPHIVAAFDFGRHAGRLFLAMELVEGQDVERLIQQRGPLSEWLVWHIIRQAAAGLAHASQVGVIHRDIKPANLLLVEPPKGFPLPEGVPLVKIADFGLSILGDEQGAGQTRLTSDSMHVGSPLYMAPEQLESTDLDHKADIFALGATAWHMFVGKPPLQGQSLRQIVLNRLTQPTAGLGESAPQVGPQSASLVAEMLAIDPRQRVGDYAALLRRIDDILATVSPTTDEQPLWSTVGAASTGPNTTQWSMDARHAPTQAFSASLGRPLTDAHGRSTAVESHSAGDARSKPRMRAFWLLLPLLLAVAAAVWGILQFYPSPLPMRRASTTGPRLALFNGQTLAGWTIDSGSWSPGVDAEGGVVLQGTNGSISRDLTSIRIESFPEAFAVEVTIGLSSAGIATVALMGVNANGGLSALVVELSDEQIHVSFKQSRGVNDVQTVPLIAEANARSLRIEWQVDAWWIILDGQTQVPFFEQPFQSLEQLTLIAPRNNAQFSDISIAPLSLGGDRAAPAQQ